MSLASVLQAFFGVKTTFKINPITDTVAVTPTKILSYNPNRLGLVITNIGATDIYLTPDNKPSSSRGIYISSGGGGVSFKFQDDFELVGSEFYAIGIGGVATVYVQEVVDLTPAQED